MANPKRKHTRMRTSLRRSHWKITAPNCIPCPQCKEPKLSHRICPSCGFYNNKLVQAVTKKKKKKDEGSKGE